MRKTIVCMAVVLMLMGSFVLPAKAALPAVPEKAIALSQISVRFLEGYDDAVEVSSNILENPGYICPADAYGAPLPFDFYLEVKVERFDATKNKWLPVDLYLLPCGKGNLGSPISREVFGIYADKYKYTFNLHASIPGIVYAYDKEDKINARLWDNILAWTKHEPFVWCQNCDWKAFNDAKDPLIIQDVGVSCHAKSLITDVILDGVKPGDTIMAKGQAIDEFGRVFKSQACATGNLLHVNFSGLFPDSEFTIKIEVTNFRKTVSVARRVSTIPATDSTNE